MSDAQSSTYINDDRIHELLDRWEALEERGETISVEELCRSHPDLRDEVRRHTRALRTVDRRFQGLPDAATDHGEQLQLTSDVSALEFFAKGGLGAVYVGEHRSLNRRVAVKFIHTNLVYDPAARQRFALEAEVTGRLEHPGVVPLHGIGETAGGRMFYVMRFIDGSTLDQAIRRCFEQEHARPGGQVVEARRLLTSFVSVCKTIAYAHNRGIVHRDIKPDNVLLGRYGETLVVDWGLALPVLREERFRQSGEKTLMPSGGSSSGSDSSLGAGTPAYMSPEQASGLAPTPASDIYSLGATLFKILTGTSPICAETLAEIKTKILEGRLRWPSEVRREVPRPLDAICRRAMALHPADRYATALDLARDVERFLADEPVEAFPEPFTARLSRFGRRHRLATQIAVGGLAMCLMLMVISSMWLGNLAHREQTARTSAEQSRQVAEESRRENLRSSALYLAKSVAQEIDLRWRILEAEAASPKLREMMATANHQLLENQTLDAAHQAALQSWLDKRYIANSSAVKGIWWLNAIEGTQVARVPESQTADRNFRHRDYFHGRGRDLPRESPEVDGLTPLAGKIVHMSPAFESTNTGTLMVAFSVPVWSDSMEEANRQPLGVLVMAVELGDFAIGRHAVLADTRIDQLTGQRGLILHHPRLGLKSSDQALPRLGDAALEHALLLRAERRQANRLQSGGQSSVLERFQDAVIGDTRLAAMEPVSIVGRPTEIADTGWVVIAEEATE